MNRLSIPRAISVGCLIFIAVAACSQATEGGGAVHRGRVRLSKTQTLTRARVFRCGDSIPEYQPVTAITLFRNYQSICLLGLNSKLSLQTEGCLLRNSMSVELSFPVVHAVLGRK